MHPGESKKGIDSISSGGSVQICCELLGEETIRQMSLTGLNQIFLVWSLTLLHGLHITFCFQQKIERATMVAVERS